MRGNLESRLRALEALSPDAAGAMAIALTTDLMSHDELDAATRAAISTWENGHGRPFPENGSVMRIILCGPRSEGAA